MLEDLKIGSSVRGILPDQLVEIIQTEWYGSGAINLTYKSSKGAISSCIKYRHDEQTLEVVEAGRPWSFDADGNLFRLVSEAERIRLAHLFDPVLAVHTSDIDPLPHQITAVYEAMLPRQPLRFLLADDPGAGKTIMAGLLIKELIARGDLVRCLVVCPGGLAEQWQDELYQKFNLAFEIATNDKLEAARTGNWFQENNLIISRLDKLSRNESVQAKITAPECRWDLVIFDEAHKLSASVFGGEISYTKRYRLAQNLSSHTRHFLLMSATPHNGKEMDFQLFMALLDGDRFEGKYRDGVHQEGGYSDMMRRMVKEGLVKFDGKPLFPERIAHTVPYQLSNDEAALYDSVTAYVRNEFNRAQNLENDKRKGTVGFALTMLQRRLASSPEAIHQSLHRRRNRLEDMLREQSLKERVERIKSDVGLPTYDLEDLEELDDASEEDKESTEAKIFDQATAANTAAELQLEINQLKQLEDQANSLRFSGQDRKWIELRGLLSEIFLPNPSLDIARHEGTLEVASPTQKLVIFTEHRDTLNYLHGKIRTLLGSDESVRIIHGSLGREERLKAQEAFKTDPFVRVLLATDAAGEGINLQRAHLMVNYDLPWNPNRLEQRFGRIHRIKQTEVCHLWNLVAHETREGEVYRKLLDKLNEARAALGGKVFDVLGKLQFDNKPLRELLIEAILHNEKPETKRYLDTVIDKALDTSYIISLVEDQALDPVTMDNAKVSKIRDDMERAEARRLQPHYIESFFIEAFKKLGGTCHKREAQRYEITYVPGPIRNRDRQIGLKQPVMQRYERVCFDKAVVTKPGQFVCPGHPLLDAVIDLTLEKNRDLLRRGTVLVDDRDSGVRPRVLFYLEHSIQDAGVNLAGLPRVLSKRLMFIEIDADGRTRTFQYAPYLDYRALEPDRGEPTLEVLLNQPECSWISAQLEKSVVNHAVQYVVPQHLKEVSDRKVTLLDKTEAAVKDRLTKEINHWDHRANELKLKESAGKAPGRLNSTEARRRAEQLQERLERRLDEIRKERQIMALPPVVLGGTLVVPIGLVARIIGKPLDVENQPIDTQESAAKAREAVMAAEWALGFTPVDRELEKLGYDIESKDNVTGHLRFIEVKGRVEGADYITVTKNEILFSLSNTEQFILAMVEFSASGSQRVRYLRKPFQKEPDFSVTSVNYSFAELLAKAGDPQ